MNIEFKKLVRLRQIITNRFRRGISTRGAIGISIILHLLLGSALASYFMGTLYIHPAQQKQSIEFDLSTEKLSMTASNDLNGENAKAHGAANLESSEETGKSGNLMTGSMNREAVFMSSLASLSDLRESFRFIMQQVSADSLGGFSPVDGQAPGSEYNSLGYKDGEGLGYGHGAGIYVGGGLCAPSPAPSPGR